jgi:hypothetical protein
MNRNDITVNGKILDEFLKDNVSVKEDIEQKKLFREQTENIRLGRHIKPKFKPLKERNGEVKILGQREINIANFDRYLEKSLKAENILESLTIVLIAYPKQKIFTTNEIASIIDRYLKRYDIPILRSTGHSLRGRLGLIRKSELSDFMVFYERNSFENKTNVMKYGIREDALNELTIDEAIELAHTRKKAFKDKSVVLNPDRSKQKNAKPGPKPKKEVIAETPPKKEVIAETPLKKEVINEKPDLITEIISQIKSIKSDDENAMILIKGDIHIHINISR